jgi:hypothetical protein
MEKRSSLDLPQTMPDLLSPRRTQSMISFYLQHDSNLHNSVHHLAIKRRSLHSSWLPTFQKKHSVNLVFSEMYSPQ